MKRLLMLVAATAMAQCACAAPPCLDAANTVAKNQCLSGEVQAREQQLAQLAGDVAGRLARVQGASPMFPTATAFQQAQAAWQRWRDAECEARRLLWGAGTGAPAAYAACVIELSDARILSLQGDAWPR